MTAERYSSYKKCFWKLKMELYGLKQVGQAWYNKLNNELINIGFTRLKSDAFMSSSKYINLHISGLYR